MLKSFYGFVLWTLMIIVLSIILGCDWMPTIDYFGQEPPGSIPKLVAPGFISTEEHEEVACTFYPDGKEFYFTRHQYGKCRFYSHNNDIYWVEAKAIERLRPNEAIRDIKASVCTSAPDAVSVEVSRIKYAIYKLCVDDFVNLVAFIGPEGVLLVDTGFDESSEQVKSILKELGGGGNIQYIINTHSDYDHIAGNAALRGNAVVLAHTRYRSQLMEYADPEYDIPFDKSLFRGAYPTITFEEPITLYFNGDEIKILPLTGGHTDEDVIVYFKNAGVVCLGDMISPGSFPVVKLNNGGNVHTLVENVERLISLFSEDVTFIVGHGEDMTVKELHTYHDMLKSTIATVQAAMKANMTVEEMKQRNILEDWSSFDDPENEETTAEAWIETIYKSSRKRRRLK